MEKMTYDRGGREQKKERAERLIAHIGEIATSVNREMKDKYGKEDFLNDECAIDMESYGKRSDSISSEEVARDLEATKAREAEWFGVEDNENTQEHFRNASREEIVRRRKDDAKREKGYQCEMIVTALFYKFFKDDFIIARASAHDDHINHADNILLNKKTGDVICAFDEVHDHAQSDRRQKKEERMDQKLNPKGTRLKYGFYMIGDSVKEGRVNNLPIFCVSLSTAELENLLAGMNFSINEKPGEAEQLAMRKFLESLETQKEAMKKIHLEKAVRNNLDRFESSLAQMKKMTE